MPKMKTNRGAAKRFRLTASGRIKRDKAYGGHNFTCKTREQKRRIRKSGLVAASDAPRIRRLISA